MEKKFRFELILIEWPFGSVSGFKNSDLLDPYLADNGPDLQPGGGGKAAVVFTRNSCCTDTAGPSLT